MPSAEALERRKQKAHERRRNKRRQARRELHYEGDYAVWISETGLKCKVLHVERSIGSWWCGYVVVPPGNKYARRVDAECFPYVRDVYGGVTFIGSRGGEHCVGFDTAHALVNGDPHPKKSMAWAVRETEKLAQFISQ